MGLDLVVLLLIGGYAASGICVNMVTLWRMFAGAAAPARADGGHEMLTGRER